MTFACENRSVVKLDFIRQTILMKNSNNKIIIILDLELNSPFDQFSVRSIAVGETFPINFPVLTFHLCLFLTSDHSLLLPLSF